ncbi:MAG: arabinogalactan endo-1,4-beta-galactosidase [Candidatus Azobacteroides sp.]|nr:arabinogalactan endo-1,4-beta-galactosidase [Candidatus Azobacteroides sp.]
MNYIHFIQYKRDRSKQSIFICLIVVLSILFSFFACSDDHSITSSKPPVSDRTAFAKGTDVSWLTQMEKEGCKFYNANGRETECMTLLRDLGMNSIRLRVWVDPVDGWCNKNDVRVKALRAYHLGLRIMINFHYSDTWADPGKQTKPDSWKTLAFNDLKDTVAAYTKDVLTALKADGVAPEWVQVGNETGDGMLWEDGRASTRMKNYADLNNAGYDAVKEVFPQAKVIVHLQDGSNNSLFRWLFDGLKNNGGKWDVIGMSLYPDANNWKTMNEQCLTNINDLISRYGSEVMICEVGMSWDQAETCKNFLTDLIAKAQAVPQNQCLGLFYWEPEGYVKWSGYTLSAFDNSGRPTAALDAFK